MLASVAFRSQHHFSLLWLTAHDSPPPLLYVIKASRNRFLLVCCTAYENIKREDYGAQRELKKKFQPGTVEGGTPRLQQLRFLTLFNRGFGAQAVWSETRRTRVQIRGFGEPEPGSMDLSGQHEIQPPHRRVSATMLSHSQRLDQTDSEEISGRGGQVVRQAWMWSRGERERGNQGLDRAAVIGVGPPRCDRAHLTDDSQLEVRVWLSGLRAGPSRSSARPISFTGCIHNPPHHPPPPLLI